MRRHPVKQQSKNRGKIRPQHIELGQCVARGTRKSFQIALRMGETSFVHKWFDECQELGVSDARSGVEDKLVVLPHHTDDIFPANSGGMELHGCLLRAAPVHAENQHPCILHNTISWQLKLHWKVLQRGQLLHVALTRRSLCIVIVG